MGSILISVPDIAESDLIYDEGESRQILKFFWPSLAADIDALTIGVDARRLGQTALIAAIDGSYAMGYVEAIFGTITRRNSDIASLVRKLSKKFIRHWWQHTQAKDLDEVRIYESVRVDIARSLRGRLDGIIMGTAPSRGTVVLYAQCNASFGVWI